MKKAPENIDPTTLSNMRVFRYMNRIHEQKLVEWKLDLLLHDPKSTAIITYQNDWKKLMDVVDEFEKDESIDIINVSSKGTSIKFKTGETLVEKVNKTTDKKLACWKAIIKYLDRLEEK